MAINNEKVDEMTLALLYLTTFKDKHAANVFARVKPRPRSGAGAVALEEPDDEEP
jgi:hypothetical protein